MTIDDYRDLMWSLVDNYRMPDHTRIRADWEYLEDSNRWRLKVRGRYQDRNYGLAVSYGSESIKNLSWAQAVMHSNDVIGAVQRTLRHHCPDVYLINTFERNQMISDLWKRTEVARFANEAKEGEAIVINNETFVMKDGKVLAFAMGEADAG